MRLNLLPYSDEVSNLCALYGVERLELFGSAARPDFDPADSDLDFLVDFADAHTLGAFDRYFGLKEDLEKLQLLKILPQILLASSIFLLSSCGGEAPPIEEFVETAADRTQNQAQETYRGAIELGAHVVRVVNKQAIEPYLSKKPVLPDNAEVGFTPKYIPLRLAIDTDGNVLISTSSSIVTDFGVIDVETSKTIISQENEHLLIIQIDDQVAVYKLPPIDNDKAFQVDFSDNYSKYRILSFEQRATGNIVLKLESFESNK